MPSAPAFLRCTATQRSASLAKCGESVSFRAITRSMITLLFGCGAPSGPPWHHVRGRQESKHSGSCFQIRPVRSLLGYDPRSISGEDSELSVALFSFGVAVRAVLSRRVRRSAELSRQTGAGNRAVRARRGDRRGVSPARSEIV